MVQRLQQFGTYGLLQQKLLVVAAELLLGSAEGEDLGTLGRLWAGVGGVGVGADLRMLFAMACSY